MTKDEALKLALEALEDIFGKNKVDVTAINVIKEALAQPDPVIAEREACAVICDNRVLYTGYDCAAAIRSRDVYKMGWPIGDPRDILKSAKPRSQS